MSVGERLRRILSKEPVNENEGEFTAAERVMMVAFRQIYVGSRADIYFESLRVSRINHLPEESPADLWKAGGILEERGFLQPIHDTYGWRMTKKGRQVAKSLIRREHLQVLE